MLLCYVLSPRARSCELMEENIILMLYFLVNLRKKKQTKTNKQIKTLVCARKGCYKVENGFFESKKILFPKLLKRMKTVLSSVINYKKNTFSASSAIIDIIKAYSRETLNFSNSTAAANGSRVSLEGDF